ncbi:MAG: hypothetical protein RBR09_07155 [Desulfobulbaceae bacterium]|jgi:ATPase subunit of ABC transporter with duplicated ATPase domains|nr:hypothetical protein [Desulfobulbaceae bacterium]MDY0351013.1 hypothetical protein [Desulfobulbaceae bacterium]
MRIKILLLTVATILWWADGYCEENIYTWKDKNGVLNITDHAPPSDAEILDISPSHRQQAEEYWRQRREIQERARQAEEERRMKEQAAAAERREAEARRQAEELMERARRMEEMRKPERKKRGY